MQEKITADTGETVSTETLAAEMPAEAEAATAPAKKLNLPRKLNRNVGTVWEMTKRNCLLFLRNKSTVIFAFMAPLLILGFYILFMSDMQVNLVKEMIAKELPDMVIDDKAIASIVDSWLVSGVVSIACLTVGLNSMFVIIADKERKTINDFTASPLKPVTLLLSYFLSSFFLTFTLCLLVMIIGIVFISVSGGVLFTFPEIMQLLLVLFLSCLSADIMMICIMSLFKTNATSSAFNGVFSALIGFLIGAYLPVSMLPNGVQYFANLIPGSHSTALFRNIFITKAMEGLDIAPAFYEVVNSVYSLDLKLFGATLTVPYMYLYLTASIVVFFIVYLIINRVQTRLKK